MDLGEQIAALRKQMEEQEEYTLKHEPKADKTVLRFITNLMICAAKTEDEYEIIRSTFRAGYCWHFAHILKTTFGRGKVCWAAPFGHFVWIDENGVAYDAEGVNFGDQDYNIPESYLGDSLNDFRHIPGQDYNASASEVEAIIRKYEDDNSLPHKEIHLEDIPMQAWVVKWHCQGRTGTYRCKVVAPSKQRAARLMKEHIKELSESAQSCWETATEHRFGSYIAHDELGRVNEEEGCYDLPFDAWNTGSDHLND